MDEYGIALICHIVNWKIDRNSINFLLPKVPTTQSPEFEVRPRVTNSYCLTRVQPVGYTSLPVPQSHMLNTPKSPLQLHLALFPYCYNPASHETWMLFLLSVQIIREKENVSNREAK